MARRKRRSRGDGGLYQRNDGMWIGVVELPQRPGDTTRRRRTVSAKRQADAKRKLEALRAQLAQHGGDLPERGTVEQWLTYWFREVCTVGPGTRPDYRRAIERDLVPGLGRRPLEQLRPEHVRDLYSAMVQDGRGGAVGKAHIVIRKALSDAEREGRVLRNVARLVSPPRGKPVDREAMPTADARALLAHIEGDRLASRWQAALMVGARQGECLGLQWDRLDLEAGTAELSWQLRPLTYYHGCPDDAPCGRRRAAECPVAGFGLKAHEEATQLAGRLHLVRPKSAAGHRVVPLVSSMVKALRSRREAYEAERSGYGTDHGLVWARPDGTPYAREADSRAWHEVCRAAGVTELPLHSARRTTATLLLEAGIDPHVVEAILGHADIETTRGYQDVRLAHARKALGKVERALAPQAPISGRRKR